LTGGWGFAQFNDGKPADGAVRKTCFACHEPAKARDFVFTRYRTLSASDGIQSRHQKKEQQTMNMKLEVVIIPVSDVDRAKAFYEKLGFRLDGDFVVDEKLRVLQFTPPRSEASIIFGKGVTSAKPGSTDGLVLAVDDIDAARADLVARGVEVSEVFHYAGFPFNNSVDNPRVSGRDPEGRTYFTFASFEDPDGNRWLLQEITTRLPGREWK
jgi:catechol 2,3-dioxygenase-like lactoylglutathione lyase family enzyme